MASENEMKDNTQLTAEQLADRRQRLNAAKDHITSSAMKFPYTKDHAVVKALDREIKDIEDAQLKQL